ncbi:hypothetical protein NO2_0212 [Candidatus Termititenax persephonae]|uniref:DUF4160 domain-containing protein n=1 Tax=Candidatus Termititenax persephonae TaxID=2218525 RepID=A0A388TFX6_9BACT|nr:hypothetical protein NO2_0212 [Candidatus Termititenax persephonae]
MPELCRFQGVIIQMYFEDIKRHHKPHIHVIYNKYKATIAIDGELLGGSLPVKEMRRVLAWIILREDELYAAWNKAVRKEKFGKIKP